jgi:ABC-type multidrug transport system permease subunit
MGKVEARQRQAALERMGPRFNGNDGDSRQQAAPLPRQVASALRSAARSVGQTLRKFAVLQKRAWRQVLRDQPLHLARLASSAFSALLFGAIYFRMGNSITTVPDRLGLLQVAAVNTAMSALIKATTSFVTEKLIVQRERRRGLYPVVPYFLAKVCAEVPVTALYSCLGGALMYQLCGLNPAPGRLQNFLAILAAEATAASALGMSVGEAVVVCIASDDRN